jgi:hypothetical protein
MQKIKIGFSKPNSSNKFPIYSWLIRLAQGWSDYSHVYTEVQVPEGPTIFQASGLSVNEESKVQFLTHAEIVIDFEFEISDEGFMKIKQFFFERLGRPYSIKQVFGLFLFHIGIKTKMFKDNDLAYVCSELIAESMEKFMGFKFEKQLDFIEPIDIYKKIIEIKNPK